MSTVIQTWLYGKLFTDKRTFKSTKWLIELKWDLLFFIIITHLWLLDKHLIRGLTRILMYNFAYPVRPKYNEQILLDAVSQTDSLFPNATRQILLSWSRDIYSMVIHVHTRSYNPSKCLPENAPKDWSQSISKDFFFYKRISSRDPFSFEMWLEPVVQQRLLCNDSPISYQWVFF